MNIKVEKYLPKNTDKIIGMRLRNTILAYWTKVGEIVVLDFKNCNLISERFINNSLIFLAKKQPQKFKTKLIFKNLSAENSKFLSSIIKDVKFDTDSY